MENNTFDWNTFSCIFAVVIGIIAFVSPIITAIINNCHQTKIKKLDMYEESKRKALNDFIDNAEDYLLNLHDINQTAKYYSSLNKLFIYFSDINLQLFVPFEKATKDKQYDIASVALVNIVATLSKQIIK